MKHGCQLLREGARHSWCHNPSLNKRSAVPRHNDIDEDLARKICRDSESLGSVEPLPQTAADRGQRRVATLRFRQQSGVARPLPLSIALGGMLATLSEAIT